MVLMEVGVVDIIRLRCSIAAPSHAQPLEVARISVLRPTFERRCKNNVSLAFSPNALSSLQLCASCGVGMNG